MSAVRNLAAAALGALVLAGCSSSNSDFIAQAEAEGITVHHPDLVRGLVADLCGRMDAGLSPMGAGLATMENHLHDPEYSTNDRRVMQVGVHDVCSDHGAAWDAYEMTYQQGAMTETPAAPVVLGFGETHIFEAGTEVSMTASLLDGREPTEQIPGDMVKLTVTVTNGTSEVINPSNAAIDYVSREGGPVGSWALGEEYGVTMSQGDLLPGESETFDIAVEMTDATKSLRVKTVEPTSSGGSTTVYFEGVPTQTEQTSVSQAPVEDSSSEAPGGNNLESGESSGTEDQYCSDNPTDPMCMTDEEFDAYYGTGAYEPTEEDLQRVSESGGGYGPGTPEHETCSIDPTDPICAS